MEGESVVNLCLFRFRRRFGWGYRCRPILVGMLFLSLLAERSMAAVPPEYRVAIIRDDDSWYFDAMVTRFIGELMPLAQDSYLVTFDQSHNAKGNFDAIEGMIDQVMADPKIDLIYTAGVVATEIASSMDAAERGKPVIGGALQMVDLSLMNISKEGTSTIPNYTFITNPQRVGADLGFLKRLVDPKTIHVLIDEPIIERLSILKKGTEHFEATLKVKLNVVGSAVTADETLQSLPPNIEAMYVALQPRMIDSERKKLFIGLAKRGIPTVSMWGRLDVELGAMAGMESDTRSAVARRIALNIHQLLNDVKTDSLPVYLPLQDRKVINLGTARLTDWSPDYDISFEAEFINTEANIGSLPLTLREAIERSRDQNAAVLIASEDPVIRREELAITRSRLLPSADLISRYGGTRYSDIINPMLTPNYARQGSLGVQLRQLLYSDAILSTWRAQKRAVKSAELDLESRRLDVTFETVGAYLDVLSARALRAIERENLTLTENNLSLAKLRRDIGAAEPSEVFRWERDQARNRAALIERDYLVKNAMIALNQVMGTPREQVWKLEDIDVANDEFYFLGDRLDDLVENLSEFERFGSFLRQYAVLASPELASFDYGLVGQGILLRQKKRRFYLPEVALSAGADRVQSRSSFQGRDRENQVTLGIELSFPLFTGGERRAEVRKQRAEIRQLSEQREQALQQLELAALSAKNNIGSAHPNIRLNRISLTAAENLYQSVLQKYSLGATDYITLLDAQQALIVQRQQAALAVYQYLLEIHRVQRSIAWFEFDQSGEEIEAWVNLLRHYLETGEFQDSASHSLSLGRDVRGAAAAIIQSVQSK